MVFTKRVCVALSVWFFSAGSVLCWGMPDDALFLDSTTDPVSGPNRMVPAMFDVFSGRFYNAAAGDVQGPMNALPLDPLPPLPPPPPPYPDSVNAVPLNPSLAPFNSEDFDLEAFLAAPMEKPWGPMNVLPLDTSLEPFPAAPMEKPWGPMNALPLDPLPPLPPPPYPFDASGSAVPSGGHYGDMVVPEFLGNSLMPSPVPVLAVAPETEPESFNRVRGVPVAPFGFSDWRGGVLQTHALPVVVLSDPYTVVRGRRRAQTPKEKQDQKDRRKEKNRTYRRETKKRLEYLKKFCEFPGNGYLLERYHAVERIQGEQEIIANIADEKKALHQQRAEVHYKLSGANCEREKIPFIEELKQLRKKDGALSSRLRRMAYNTANLLALYDRLVIEGYIDDAAVLDGSAFEALERVS